MTKKKNKFVGLLGKKKIYIGPNGQLYSGGGGPDAETYHNSPSMAITRANGKEFGLASHIGSNIRFSLRMYKYIFRTLMHSNLHSLIRAMARADKNHLSGERSFDFITQGKLLHEFSLTTLLYNSVVTFSYTLEVSINKKNIVFSVTSFLPERDLNFPPQTDFFRLFMTTTLVSSYFYDETKKDYVPPVNQEFILTKTIETQKFEKISATPDISLSIEFDFEPDPIHGLIICLGIEFFDVLGSNTFIKKEWAAMKVHKVC